MGHSNHDHFSTIELAAEIASAYVAHNSVQQSELAALIRDIYEVLSKPLGAATAEPEKQEPAVSIRTSVKPDHITCLEDGKKFKSLKRHLATEHGMTPADYRAKWGLKADYPMVAPAYSQARSALAMSMGLGRKAVEPAPAQKPARARRGRKTTAAGQ